MKSKYSIQTDNKQKVNHTNFFSYKQFKQKRNEITCISKRLTKQIENYTSPNRYTYNLPRVNMNFEIINNKQNKESKYTFTTTSTLNAQ